MDRWNWEQPDWPHFRWDASRLAEKERKFHNSGGVLIGTVGHLGSAHRESLYVECISGEAVTTSEIEGELLDRASVQSSLRRKLGLASDNRRVGPKEDGIAQLMLDLFANFLEPLSHETLHSWHRKLLPGRGDVAVGEYRSGSEPMEIISGAIGKERVHFVAPPSARLPAETDRFLDWFNRTSWDGPEPLPALTRAGIAHLYFESINPYEDGNGRIGRAIAEKALAQGLRHPTLTALSTTILARRKEYYRELELASKTTEITQWLAWFADVTLEAQQRTIRLADFLVGKSHLLDRMRGALNDRQEKALLRLLREGPDGFEGGLSAGNYATITGASPATATRDLADLVEKGALTRTGERRHARYFAALPSPEPIGFAALAAGSFAAQ